MKKNLLVLGMLLTLLMKANAAVDPNFYIYLCFGQSNMEGNAAPEALEQICDARFQTLACVDFSNPQRTKGQWYTALPPIVRQGTGVGMADYFGRTMVAALPANVKVGVVDVAIGGVSIDGFLQEEVANYLQNQPDWMKNSFSAYGNDPYKRLVDMAKIAQQSGVIKGILLHQGETNNGSTEWPGKVKTIYNRLLTDLGLNAADVPLLIGETVNADVNGTCAGHNNIIATMPSVIPTSHVIPSNGCPRVTEMDGAIYHFSVVGYRIMGKRYAYEALRQLGKPTQAQAGFAWNADQKKIYQLTSLAPVEDITIRLGGSKKLAIWGTFADGHQENLTNEVTFSSSDFTVSADGTITGSTEKKGIVTVTYTDFLGNTASQNINVEVSDQGPNHVLEVNNGTAGSNSWDKQLTTMLNGNMTIGKTYVITAYIKAENPGDIAQWPIWSTSPNRDTWGNSADVEYLATYKLTNTWQQFTWEFTPKYTHDKLQFAFGLIGGKVYFDDISCKEKGSSVEMVVNGSFESDDISKYGIIGYMGQTMTITEDNTTAIRAVTTRQPAADNKCYDLQGREVAQPTKGIYIIDGRKVIR